MASYPDERNKDLASSLHKAHNRYVSISHVDSSQFMLKLAQIRDRQGFQELSLRMMTLNKVELLEMGQIYSYFMISCRLNYSPAQNKVVVGYESITFSNNLLQILGYTPEEFVKTVRTFGFVEYFFLQARPNVSNCFFLREFLR
jgi:hypothetical protein